MAHAQRDPQMPFAILHARIFLFLYANKHYGATNLECELDKECEWPSSMSMSMSMGMTMSWSMSMSMSMSVLIRDMA